MAVDKPLKDRLKEAMENRGVKIPAVAKLTGIPKDRIYAWYRDDTNPKLEDAAALEKWLTGGISAKSEENVPYGTLEMKKGTDPKATEDPNLSLQTIHNLSQSNKILAEAAKIKAETDKLREEKEKVLVQSNADLTNLLKSTAHEPGYNLLGHPYIVKKLLETLAELGTGTLWKTKEDGLILLGNRLSLPDDEEEMKGGTRGTVGKKSIVRQH